MQSGKDTVIYH